MPNIGLDLKVLGPIRVTRNENPIALAGPKPRLVLALLIVRVGRTVSVDELIDGIWDGNAPKSARSTLQVYVHRLRKALGPVIETVNTGYGLTIDPSTIDARRFEAEAKYAGMLLRSEPAVASQVLRGALALWSGRPFQDLEHTASLQPEIARLADLKITSLENRIEADMRESPSGELVSEIQFLASQHPLRERLVRLLMRALYRNGRQVEALQTAERHRRFLRSELGIDPSPELVELETQILNHRLPPRFKTPTSKSSRQGGPSPAFLRSPSNGIGR